MKVLVTGAYGLIGNLVFKALADQPDLFTVYGLDRNNQPSDRIRPQDVIFIPERRFMQADLGDRTGLERALQGMEAVVHMAADPGSGDWESIHRNNLVGVYHLFEACRQAQVGKVVFASSVMVHFGHFMTDPFKAIREGRFEDLPVDFKPLNHLQPTTPAGLYASSKLWGEALAYQYSLLHAMSCCACGSGGWWQRIDLVRNMVAQPGAVTKISAS